MFPGPELPFSFPRRYSNRGVALFLVLSLIVIVSLILVAFVTTMRLEQAASLSYSQSELADNIARSSLNFIVADLQNEMAEGSSPDTTFPKRFLYENVSETNISPRRLVTAPSMPSLFRISTDTSDTGLPASQVASSTRSKNGRFVSAERWSAPRLGTFPADIIPSWILITREGPTNGDGASFTGSNAINNPAPDNSRYAIGRFAYAAYDIGGLIDVGSAGYPSSSLDANAVRSIKATQAAADLSVIGIDAGKLVAWRNSSNAASGPAYLDYITNTALKNGFQKVAPGDTTFLSRQDLINAATMGVGGLDTDTLTNLTVFSRERNAPSFRPTSPNGTNVWIPSIRHTSATTVNTYDTDGQITSYDVVAGDPVANRRFPLGRLRWIGPRGPQDGGTAASINACFGLRWNATKGTWEYTALSTSTKGIKTLEEVRDEQREPNFFELLQAGIATGSLGSEGQLSAGGKATDFPFGTVHQLSRNLHILRIGAAIISQYQPEATPVVVEFDQSGTQWQASGVDNLPYLNMIHFLSGQNSSNSLGCYLLFGLWNPHRGIPTTQRPPIRLRVTGSVMVANAYGIYPNVIPYGDLSMARPGYTRVLDATIELSNQGVNGFIDPHALLPADLNPVPGTSNASGMEWSTLPPIDGVTYAGYRLPDFSFDTERKAPDGKPTSYNEQAEWQKIMFWVNMDASNPFNCWLEYQNPDGVWVPYNYFAGINDEATWLTKPTGYIGGHMGEAWANTTELGLVTSPQPWDPPAGLSLFYYIKYVWEAHDPRTLRFNWTQHQTDGSTPAWRHYLNSSIWSSTSGSPTTGRIGPQVAQKIFGPPWVPSGLARNNNMSFEHASKLSPAAYVDPDKVQRLADSGLFTGAPASTGWKGNPFSLSTDRVEDRPVILNRPFHSVAELGYASRDYPWRTLDFFTTNSADASLLDLFTVSESIDPVLPGKLNLNSISAPVFQALFNNAIPDPLGSTPVSHPDVLSASLIEQTTQQALVGKEEIVTRLGAELKESDFGSEDEEKLKPRREVIARTLGDVGQVRTWNILIDVIAQAGRYPQNVTSLEDFIVEGERRYWLHIAIDRFTGEVLDRQLEVVNP